MENYNEKQIILNREITEMREVAHQNFNRRRNELITLKAETGHVFEQEKKTVANAIKRTVI